MESGCRDDYIPQGSIEKADRNRIVSCHKMGGEIAWERSNFSDQQRSIHDVKCRKTTVDCIFLLAGDGGLKSCITPTLGGDSKRDQNHFLMEPVSIENLHNNKNTRNFWCRIKNRGYWSACGSSAEAEFLRFTGEQEKSVLEAGFMWQKLTRTSAVHGLKAEITSFVTVDGAMEVMMTELTNITEEPLEMTPIAVMPVYGRSADNIRDHRHVTSLLHRILYHELWGGGDACDVV